MAGIQRSVCRLLLSLGPAVFASVDASADELTSVWQALSTRQREATTATVSWTKRFRKTAAAARIDMFDGPATKDQNLVTEIEDIESTPVPCSLSVSGETACRYENWGLSFAQGNRGLSYRSIIAYDDAGTYRSFTGKSGAVETHSGRIDERDSPPVWDALHIKPLVFALRPLRPEAFGPTPETWAVDDAPSVIDGRECMVLRGHPPAFASGNTVYEIFLDRARDDLPLRYVGKNRETGKVFSQVDIRYDRDEAPAWVPSHWKVTSFLGSGEVSESSENNDVEVALGLTLPPETFRIDYPAGTVVSDGRKGSELFVANEDGAFVPLRTAEARATISGTGIWPWIAATAGAAILGAALITWWRRSTAGERLRSGP